MAYHVLPKRLKQLGFCCAFEYFNATQNIPTSDIQKELKLHLRTVRRWRSRWRNEELKCEELNSCLRKPHQCPDQARNSEQFQFPPPTYERDEDLD